MKIFPDFLSKTFSLILCNLSKALMNLTFVFLDGGRKPEYLQRTLTCTGKTCKLHTERPGWDSNQEPSNCALQPSHKQLLLSNMDFMHRSFIHMFETCLSTNSNKAFANIPEQKEISTSSTFSLTWTFIWYNYQTFEKSICILNLIHPVQVWDGGVKVHWSLSQLSECGGSGIHAFFSFYCRNT